MNGLIHCACSLVRRWYGAVVRFLNSCCLQPGWKKLSSKRDALSVRTYVRIPRDTIQWFRNLIATRNNVLFNLSIVFVCLKWRCDTSNTY